LCADLPGTDGERRVVIANPQNINKLKAISSNFITRQILVQKYMTFIVLI
jgi:hypothetical protein